MRRRLNYKILLVSFIIVSLLTWISYMAAMFGNGGLFMIFRFPTHSLFWNLVSGSSHLFRLGLAINVVLYTFVLERIFTFLFSLRKKNH